jgi:alkylation response protein AidB-like acyl-CoA dehydrogenase
VELKLDPEDAAFRDEVREFVDANLPTDIRRRVEGEKVLPKSDYVRWQKILFEKGWIAAHWPVEHGGTGWSPLRRHIFDEVLGRAPTPRIIPFGLSMVGPVIMEFGDEAQKAHYLPRILASEDWWCQGYSEPGAGSDLASLRTRATADGDDYIVNGQKTWTTFAQYADMMFCLVRTATEGKPQEGISFLLIDMKSPGVTVRPITTLDGGQEINEVFLEDVRVPQANRVGEENKGWTYAKYLLGHERTSIAEIGRSKRELARVEAIAAGEMSGGRPLIDDPTFRVKLAAVEVGHAPGPESSLLKLKATEVQQQLTELMFEAIGPYAVPFVPEAGEDGWNEAPIGPEHAGAVAPRYFNWRKASIYGGSNEIQRNIIAKMVLGL